MKQMLFMNDWRNKINELNALICNGQTVEAMQLFYAEDIEMLENEEEPRKGKVFCIDHERANLSKTKTVKFTILNQAFDDAKQIVFSEWEIEFTNLSDQSFLLREVVVQQWKEGLVSKEKFYYKGFEEKKS
jgi:hypothetical protein